MDIKKFIASLTICFSVAYAGSYFTIPSISTWYVMLNKPFFTPPNWIFGPVWTILYFLMALSFYIVWKKKVKKEAKNSAIKVFLVQLLLNFSWSLVFFGLHLPLLAYITIIALWIAIFMTIKSFYIISKGAAYLLIPYLLWVSFATLLNLFIVFLN